MPQDQPPAAGSPAYLTTREVADLLRVKERKVYDLAAAGEIPHRRITGKLLFPSAELMAWIDGGGEPAARPRPPVLSGSHDPLLDWTVRESGSGLAMLVNGSQDGLDRFAAGEAALAGLHLPEEGGWNLSAVQALGLTGCVLIGWALRTRGLILAPTVRDRVRGLADLRGCRVVLRQPGAGAAALFERLLADEGISPSDLQTTSTPARTESDAAAAIATGEADAAIGIEAMARQFQLPFVPLIEEQFDLLVDRRAYFTPPVQAVLKSARTAAVQDKAAAMGGYDLSCLGDVRWISP